MDPVFSREIREREISLILPHLPAGGKVLEIGAGTGCQALALERAGFEVSAIDIASSGAVSGRVYPVIEYDGKSIPFPDAAFDAVFSSNTLEHIRALEDFQAEILRVLKPGGLAIHALPTPAWRLWVTVLHPVYILSRAAAEIAGLLRRGNTPAGHGPGCAAPASAGYAGGERGFFTRVRNGLAIRRHGERGNFLTEFFYFSRRWWIGLFEKTGWIVEGDFSNRIFYTGYLFFGARLGWKARSTLSAVLGSACRIYILRRRTDAKILGKFI